MITFIHFVTLPINLTFMMSMVAYLIMNDVHRSAIRTYAQSSR